MLPLRDIKCESGMLLNNITVTWIFREAQIVTEISDTKAVNTQDYANQDKTF